MTSPLETIPNPNSLSIIVPFYNEEHAAGSLVAELSDVAREWAGDVELILVDDGSTDRTLEVLRAAANIFRGCRVFSLERNSGQAAALWFGFQAARGEIIGTIDGDGQNVPADFFKLAPLLEHTDLAVGIRQDRHDSTVRKLMSRIANAVRRRVLRDGVQDSGCALKLMRREVVESFLPIRSLYSFIPAFAASQGFRIAECPVQHRARKAGVSKYGLRAMWWRPALDMLAIAWMTRRRIPRTRAVPIAPGRAAHATMPTALVR